MALRQEAFGAVRKMLFQFLLGPYGVQQEGAAVLDLRDDVEVLHVALLVAGNEVGHRDIVGGMDRLMSEAQVALGDAAGLLGVVLKIGLGVLIGVIANDLDGVLIGADRTVGTETPELAGDDALAGGHDVFSDRQRRKGDVVIDADGEVVLLFSGHVVEHGFHVGGDGVLGGETIAAAEDLHTGDAQIGQRRAYVFIQRFAGSARLLGAVEHGKDLHRLGQGSGQMLRGERTIQMDLDHADLLASGAQVIHHFQNGLTHGAHRNDHAVGVGSTVVIEQLVIAAGQFTDGVHLLLHDIRQGVVSRVAGLAGLEKGVGILERGTDSGVLGVQRMVLEPADGVPVDQFFKIRVVQHFDLLQLVGGTETIEEMHERNGALDRAQMGDAAEIHAFLHTAGHELGKAGLTAGHGVGVVTENGDGVGADGTGSHMHDAGKHGAGDTVHRRDHQHEALRGCIGGGKGTGLQSAVHGAAGAGFALHLNQLHRLTEKVLLAVRGPVVHMVGHRAGRRDGVDGGNFGERVRNIRRGLVAVHRLEHFFVFAHNVSFLCACTNRIWYF